MNTLEAEKQTFFGKTSSRISDAQEKFDEIATKNFHAKMSSIECHENDMMRIKCDMQSMLRATKISVETEKDELRRKFALMKENLIIDSEKAIHEQKEMEKASKKNMLKIMTKKHLITKVQDEIIMQKEKSLSLTNSDEVKIRKNKLAQLEMSYERLQDKLKSLSVNRLSRVGEN